MVDAGPATSPVWMRAFCTDGGVMAGLPWHLSAAGYEALRAQAGRIEVSASSPTDVLARERGVFDGFELSRASAALGADALGMLLGAVGIAARPGARVLLEGDTDPSAWLPHAFERDVAAEAEIAALDRAPIHVASRLYRDHRA
jgi:S-adenosylmethionine:diacylglycerol 3-amino-3-carboxypropyl transferase